MKKYKYETESKKWKVGIDSGEEQNYLHNKGNDGWRLVGSPINEYLGDKSILSTWTYYWEKEIIDEK